MTATKEPLVKRLKSLRDRFRSPALKFVAVVATALIIAAQIFPELSKYINDNHIIPYATLLLIIDFALIFDARRADVAVEVFPNQDVSMNTLLGRVPGTRQIDLLEYAGATTLPLIRAIKREGIPLRLLVKHPDTVEGMQRQRTIATLDTICTSIFEGHQGKLQMRCYRLPYSLKGRHFHGNLLELGWLTPDVARRTTYGSGNPHALFDLRRGDNEEMVDFFNRTFNDYWSHPETEDAATVLRNVASPPSK